LILRRTGIYSTFERSRFAPNYTKARGWGAFCVASDGTSGCFKPSQARPLFVLKILFKGR
jgi:hypothetical protein